MRLLRPQPNLRALPEGHIQGQWQTSKFDKSTGQVYTETTAAIQCSDDRNWTQEKYSQACITDEFGLANHLWEFRRDATASRKGKSRTLKDIAIQCIVRNISDATLELINCLPSELRRQVWDALKESIAADNPVSFKTWSIFSESLHRDTPDPYLYHFACTIAEPKSPLNVYTAPLASNPLSFITSLNITVPCPVPDLVRLSDVTNLAVLEIAYKKAVSDRALGIGDRLIRAWQLAALNSGAFPVLRILRLWDFKNVTERSLSFLNDFPALAVYDVRGCGFGGSPSPPPPLGWTRVSIDSLFNTLTSVYKDHVLSWFRLRNISTELEPKAEVANSQQSKPPPSFGRNKMTFISRAEVPDILNESGFTPYRLGADMWEEITYRLSPLIGATRNDIDLVRSKYNIGDPVAVQQVLGSSIPMVSLRLGYKRTARSSSQYTTYIRDNLTHPLNASVCESGRKVPEDGRESMHREATKREREGQDVMQKKKRKLNDLLNSLL